MAQYKDRRGNPRLGHRLAEILLVSPHTMTAHAALEEMDRARGIVAEAMAAAPDLTAELVEDHECYRNPAVKRALVEALVRAGLPERRTSPAS